MAFERDDLLAAFREDHARLGRGFHELSRQLRERNIKGAIDAARRLDEEAGAHIAFEEGDFYPLLVDYLGRDVVKRLLGEHGEGYSVITEVLEQSADHPMMEDVREGLLYRSEAMENHMAECGELFAAMGRISTEVQAALFQRLESWRQRRPSWTKIRKQNAG